MHIFILSSVSCPFLVQAMSTRYNNSSLHALLLPVTLLHVTHTRSSVVVFPSVLFHSTAFFNILILLILKLFLLFFSSLLFTSLPTQYRPLLSAPFFSNILILPFPCFPFIIFPFRSSSYLLAFIFLPSCPPVPPCLYLSAFMPIFYFLSHTPTVQNMPYHH